MYTNYVTLIYNYQQNKYLNTVRKLIFFYENKIKYFKTVQFYHGIQIC